MSTVTAERIVSASVGYSNRNNEGREWNIYADATISNGSVTSFVNGQIQRVQANEETGHIPSASFAIGADNTYASYSFVNANPDEQIQIIRALDSFVNNVLESVKENPINASV